MGDNRPNPYTFGKLPSRWFLSSRWRKTLQFTVFEIITFEWLSERPTFRSSPFSGLAFGDFWGYHHQNARNARRSVWRNLGSVFQTTHTRTHNINTHWHNNTSCHVWRMVKITSIRFKQNSRNEEKLGCRRSVRRVTYRALVKHVVWRRWRNERVSCTVSSTCRDHWTVTRPTVTVA